MAITFTPAQRRVIDLHHRNILVSAAAGSGKTAVLVERIIQMICDEKHPVDIDRLLIVTFTNAAASEMRERIAAGIAGKLSENPESEHVQRQAALLHNAQITTIDSFCLFLLRNHFNEIGLDPAFRVADEGEIKLLQQDVLQELLEDAFGEGRQAFYDCVEYFCPGGRETMLEQHILNLWRCASSHPWPEEWLLARKEDYASSSVETMCVSPCGEYLLGHLAKLLEGCREKLLQVQRLCEEPDGPYMYGELVEKELALLEGLSRCENLEEYASKLPAVTFGRLPSKKDESVSPIKRELAKNQRAKVKDTLQTLTERFFATPLALAAAQGEACGAPVAELIDLTLEFHRRIQAKKQEKKMVDFSDIEHFALNILLKKEGEQVNPSPVALEYRQHFHEILIDEYQDSNLVQEYLLKAVSGEEDGCFNRFMVGDVKQSIYRFRLARPELFLEKYESYREEDEQRTRIDLSQNFRSRSQVVDAVNGIFENMMSRQIGGIVYDDKAALYAGAAYPENADCESELLLVEKPEKGGEQAAVPSAGEKETEALAIAQRIKSLRGSFLVTDKEEGTLRPVRFSDMVILLRTNSGWDEEFKKTLEEQGIPVYITSKTGYFAASEVQTLLQLLRVLDNPKQDIPLFGVMKSVFGGFTQEEIALLRAGKKGRPLYDALRIWSEEQPEEASEEASEILSSGNMERLCGKVSDFLSLISAYRDCTVYMPVRELLQKILNDFDYLNYVTALSAGSRRRANVEMLLTKASDFEKTSYFGLFHFVRYMEQLEKYDVDYGEADTLDENADVVRIMSIHKSKGLEFPVTFVAGLSKRFNMQDVNRSLIVDMDLGLAVDYVDAKRRIRNKTFRRMVLSRKMREDSLAEELRVLYVALTRAREKLIMTACVDKPEEKLEMQAQKEGGKLTYLDFIEAGSFLDLLLPIIGRTPVRVAAVSGETLRGEGFMEQTRLHGRRELLEIFAGCGTPEEYIDVEALQGLEERLRFQYPYSGLKNLYTKTTVSELKIAAMAQKDEAAFHAFEEKEVVPYIPSFCSQEEKAGGVLRGSAVHRVMELLNFAEIVGEQFTTFPESYETYGKGVAEEKLADKLQEFLQNEVNSLRLSRQLFEAVNIRKLVHFLKTPLAYRMWRAERQGTLHREQPFVLGVSADRLGEEFPEEETVLIQGIIDVFFEEEGELVLLDYKTDVISSMEDLWERYRVQIDYYAEALEKLLQKNVKEKILYSFYLGRES